MYVYIYIYIYIYIVHYLLYVICCYSIYYMLYTDFLTNKPLWRLANAAASERAARSELSIGADAFADPAGGFGRQPHGLGRW